jgi:excisionase family DNA binding protein
MSGTALPPWRSVPEAARSVELSEWLLRKEIKAGRLRARRIGRVVRILDEDLADWMRDGDETRMNVTNLMGTSASPSSGGPL